LAGVSPHFWAPPGGFQWPRDSSVLPEIRTYQPIWAPARNETSYKKGIESAAVTARQNTTGKKEKVLNTNGVRVRLAKQQHHQRSRRKSTPNKEDRGKKFMRRKQSTGKIQRRT